MFDDPRKQIDLQVLYTHEGWFWICPQCNDLGGQAIEPAALDDLIRCRRCSTRYRAVLDYPLQTRWTSFRYLYEYLPPLIFEECL